MRSISIALALFVATEILGCASSPPLRLAAAESSEDVRNTIFELSKHLGEPPPRPHGEDPLGASEIGFEKAVVELKQSSALYGRSTTVLLTSYKNRVGKIVVRFTGGCPSYCASEIESALRSWLGTPIVVDEGHAHLLTFSFDTTTIFFEVFPRREDLTRVVVECAAILAQEGGRAIVLPGVGERADKRKSARPICRPLPPPPSPAPPSTSRSASHQ